MIQEMLQMVLCIILCPLLATGQVTAEARQPGMELAVPAVVVTAAAQPAYKTTSRGMIVELAAPDSVSFEEQRAGSPFRFAVDKDVTADGVTLIHAGAPVTGTIIRVRQASERRRRGGQIDIQLSELASGSTVRVRLIGPVPEESLALGDPWGAAADGMQKAALIGLGIAMFVALMALLGGDR
jgi:hypothetical protein